MVVETSSRTCVPNSKLSTPGVRCEVVWMDRPVKYELSEVQNRGLRGLCFYNTRHTFILTVRSLEH